MESLGETLRRVRLEKELTIEELARKTRVRPEFLEALEEDRYEIFPARTYVVGFLRSAARALRIDEEEVLRRFRSERGDEEPEDEQLWGDDTGGEEEESTSRLLPILTVVALVIAAAVFLYLKR